jgi:hypothetical protein
MLQDDLGATMPFLRAQAESRMLSRANIRRRTGRTTQDETTGLEVPVWQTVYADIPCRISGMAANTSPYRTVNIAGATMELAARVAHFPHDTTDLRDGDLIDVTAGETAPSVWQIIEADAADQQTARRVPVIATERPEEWS